MLDGWYFGTVWCIEQEVVLCQRKLSHHLHNLLHNQLGSGVYRVGSDIPAAHLLTSGPLSPITGPLRLREN